MPSLSMEVQFGGVVAKSSSLSAVSDNGKPTFPQRSGPPVVRHTSMSRKRAKSVQLDEGVSFKTIPESLPTKNTFNFGQISNGTAGANASTYTSSTNDQGRSSQPHYGTQQSHHHLPPLASTPILEENNTSARTSTGVQQQTLPHAQDVVRPAAVMYPQFTHQQSQQAFTPQQQQYQQQAYAQQQHMQAPGQLPPQRPHTSHNYPPSHIQSQQIRPAQVHSQHIPIQANMAGIQPQPVVYYNGYYSPSAFYDSSAYAPYQRPLIPNQQYSAAPYQQYVVNPALSAHPQNIAPTSTSSLMRPQSKTVLIRHPKTGESVDISSRPVGTPPSRYGGPVAIVPGMEDDDPAAVARKAVEVNQTRKALEIKKPVTSLSPSKIPVDRAISPISPGAAHIKISSPAKNAQPISQSPLQSSLQLKNESVAHEETKNETVVDDKAETETRLPPEDKSQHANSSKAKNSSRSGSRDRRNSPHRSKTPTKETDKSATENNTFIIKTAVVDDTKIAPLTPSKSRSSSPTKSITPSHSPYPSRLPTHDKPSSPTKPPSSVDTPEHRPSSPELRGRSRSRSPIKETELVNDIGNNDAPISMDTFPTVESTSSPARSPSLSPERVSTQIQAGRHGASSPTRSTSATSSSKGRSPIRSLNATPVSDSPISKTQPAKMVSTDDIIRFSKQDLLKHKNFQKLPALADDKVIRDIMTSGSDGGRQVSGRGSSMRGANRALDRRVNAGLTSSGPHRPPLPRSGDARLDKPVSNRPPLERQNSGVRRDEESSRDMGRDRSNRGSSRRGDRNDRDSRRGTQRNRYPQPMPFSMEDIKPLDKSDNRWIPAAFDIVKSDLDEDELYVKKIEKETRGLLNKLAPDNQARIFPKFVEQLGSLEALAARVEIIAKKSFNELKYAQMYASLAKFMFQNLSVIKGTEDTSEARDEIRKTFRLKLIHKCHDTFTSRPMWSDKSTGKISEEDFEELVKIKSKALGNMRFVAELFKAGVISGRVLSMIIDGLLEQHKTPKEEDIETIVAMFHTAGHAIESSMPRDIVNGWFQKIREMAADTNLLSRLRFTLADLADLRSNRWKERPLGTGAARSVTRIDIKVEGSQNSSGTARGGSRSGSQRGNQRPALPKDEWQPILAKKTVTSPSAPSSPKKSTVTSSNAFALLETLSGDDQEQEVTQEIEEEVEPEAEELSAASSSAETMTEDGATEIGLKCAKTLIQTASLEDFADSFKDLSFKPVAVAASIEGTFDAKPAAFVTLAKAFTLSVLEKYLTQDELIEGISKIAEGLADNIVDVPILPDMLQKLLQELEIGSCLSAKQTASLRKHLSLPEPALAVQQPLTEEQVAQKGEQLAKDLFDVRAPEDFVDALGKLPYKPTAVAAALDLALQRQIHDVITLGKALTLCVQENCLTQTDVRDSFDSVIENFGDIQVDVPSLPNLLDTLLKELEQTAALSPEQLEDLRVKLPI